MLHYQIANFFFCGVALVASLVVAAPRTCKLTQVATYEYGCNEVGWVYAPAFLRNSTASTLMSCAKQCLDDDRCKSFRYISEKGKCLMFSKYLDQMSTAFDNFESGRLFNRACFTTNCNEIEACQVASNCTELSIGNYYTYTSYYTQYACRSGYISKDYKYKSRTFRFDGPTGGACRAIRDCARKHGEDGRGYYFGGFDVHYHKPSKQWVCVIFDDQGELEGHILRKEQQHISRQRYTVKDENVGKGYGYWLSNFIIYD